MPENPLAIEPDFTLDPRLVHKNLAYYISGHGYGHYARSIPVLKQLVTDFNVHIKSEIQESFFTKYFKENILHWYQPVDTGCQHFDSLEVNCEATFKKFKSFQDRSTIETEKTWLKDNQIAIVLSLSLIHI